MRRTTSPLRIVLAILAGALTAPLFVMMLLPFTVIGDWTAEGAIKYIAALPMLWLAGVIFFGGPIALAAILVLFGPLWFLHHRTGSGPGTFLGLAAMAGLVMSCLLAFWTYEPGDMDKMLGLILIFTLATVPTAGVIWAVAYAGAGAREVDPRSLPQANFTAGEPST